ARRFETPGDQPELSSCRHSMEIEMATIYIPRMSAEDRRRTAACAALIMILAVGAAGCAQNQQGQDHQSSNLGGIGAPATSPGVGSTDGATPTDGAPPTDGPTPTDGATPTTTPTATHTTTPPATPITVSVKVTGVTTAYTGLCPQPATAIRFKAVIT